jgi:hypothetical protein
MPLTEAQRQYQRDYYRKNKAVRLANARVRYLANKDAKHAYDKLRRKKKGTELRAYDRERYYAGRKYSVQQIIGRAKQRARRDGHEFSITAADLPDTPELCPVLKIPLVIHFGRGTRPDAISIDRIDSRLGYVPGNVGFVSAAANRAKGSLTIEQVRNLLAYMENPPRCNSAN